MLTRFPSLLSIYMNATHVDLTQAGTLAETVEDPNPRVNRDIARWMAAPEAQRGRMTFFDLWPATDIFKEESGW